MKKEKKQIFEDFYNNILNKETDYLEEKKKEAKNEKIYNTIKNIILITIWIILYEILEFKFKGNTNNFKDIIVFSILFCILIITLGLIFKYQKKDKYINYLIEFKKRVINKMLLLFDENLTYHPEGKIDPSIYNEAEFQTNTGFYYSDDFISGKLKNGCNYIIGDVQTTKETDKKIAEMFNGLFASVECPKNFKDSLYLRVNKNILDRVIETKRTYKKMKLELDSKEFESFFDVYASNKIIAMQLLTADIMEMLVKFKKEMNIDYEITIKNNHIYYRFLCGKIFETNDLNKFSLDKDLLYKYYKIIDFSLILSEKLTELVKDTEY